MIAAAICDLPGRLAEANLPGPLLVMIGRVFERRMRRPAAKVAAVP